MVTEPQAHLKKGEDYEQKLRLTLKGKGAEQGAEAPESADLDGVLAFTSAQPCDPWARHFTPIQISSSLSPTKEVELPADPPGSFHLLNTCENKRHNEKRLIYAKVSKGRIACL